MEGSSHMIAKIYRQLRTSMGGCVVASNEFGSDELH